MIDVPEPLAEFLVSVTYTLRLLSHSKSWQIVRGAWGLGEALWFWFVLGLTITTTIATFVSPGSFTKGIQRLGFGGLLLAAFLGVISPLATYSVIPLAVILLRQGAPLAPVAAFTISSPLINPSVFTMTAGGLGIEMAWARVLASFLLAVAGGWLAGKCEKRWGGVEAYLRHEDAAPLHVPFRHYRKSVEGLRSGRFQRMLQGREGARSWLQTFGLQLKFAGKFFVLALLISAAVAELVSPAAIMQVVGPSSRYSILLAAAAGVPLYACGGAAIPLVQVLSAMGMTPGSALAFFITGPATNVSTMLTVATLFRRNFLTLYYAVLLTGAVAAGYLFQWMSMF